MQALHRLPRDLELRALLVNQGERIAIAPGLLLVPVASGACSALAEVGGWR